MEWKLIEKFQNGKSQIPLIPDASAKFGDLQVHFQIVKTGLKAYVHGVGIFHLEFTDALAEKIKEVQK